MKLIVLLIFILNLSCLFGYGQDLIYWSSTYKIQWSDFKGLAKSDTDWVAVSHVAIEIESCAKTKLPNFSVAAWFNKKGSWTLDKTSYNLLAHEQLHFDIKELFAKRIRYSIDSLHQLNVLNFDIYTNLIIRLMNQSDVEGNTYDEETNHGKNLIRQAEWSKKITSELERLKKYNFCPCSKSKGKL